MTNDTNSTRNGKRLLHGRNKDSAAGVENPSSETSRNHPTDNNYYTIRISINFLLSAIILVCTVAYGVGRFSATFAALRLTELYTKNSSISMSNDGIGAIRSLPLLLTSSKKNIPNSVYSSKHYERNNVTTTESLLSRRLANEDQSEPSSTSIERTVDTDGSIAAASSSVYNATLPPEPHNPSGHHLLVDFKSVNGKFLNSERLLAKAMIDLVEKSGLTMLSYHCHSLHPVGVSCVGVLLESHISLHTWPIPGAICLDLFTCGPNSLLPILPTIQRLFGVARIPAVHGSIVEQPFMQWSYKLRGFRAEPAGKSAVDVRQFLHGWLEFDMKEKVVSIDTKYQQIEIYDVINPRFNSLHSYKASISKDESYEASNPELFRPDRVLYLDGILQSRYYGDSAFHEALVHPALFTHPNPKRVIIIGGGEGATLREVLKHNTITNVIMLEIDEAMVNVSKQYLPEWSDCSMIVGSAPSCFDDPRAEVIYTNAVAWMINQFAEKDTVQSKDLYDVIIIDTMYVVVFRHDQTPKAQFLKLTTHSRICFHQ
jgi:S-adenosylmethionine decarboxylase proenzyme